MSRLEIRLAPAQRAELAARAQELGLSCSAFARIGIQLLLARSSPATNPTTLKETEPCQ
jgi:hypothetical protein